MSKNEIRGALISKGYTYIRLAAELGVSDVAVGRVASHNLVSTRIMGRIAKIMGLPPAEIFPEAAHLFKKSNPNIAHPEAA